MTGQIVLIHLFTPFLKNNKSLGSTKIENSHFLEPIMSYNASVVEIHNATNSIPRF
jgi:hypothetical protein